MVLWCGLLTEYAVSADHDRHWERGARVDDSAEPDGASCLHLRAVSVLTCLQNDAFAETGGILSGTFRRMNNMAARQGCRWLWYIVFLVIVFWFFLVVWWFRR